MDVFNCISPVFLSYLVCVVFVYDIVILYDKIAQFFATSMHFV